jgi:hypothetical protein
LRVKEESSPGRPTRKLVEIIVSTGKTIKREARVASDPTANGPRFGVRISGNLILMVKARMAPTLIG